MIGSSFLDYLLFDQQCQRTTGALGCTAPEVYEQRDEYQRGDEADIFAMAVVFFFMVYGEHPFGQYNDG